MGELDVAGSSAMVVIVGLVDDAAGYIGAESLMFRALKGAIGPYLHGTQQTRLRTWAPISGEWSVEVRRAHEDGARVTMVGLVKRDGDIVMEQTASLRLSGSRPSSTHRSTSARRPTSVEPADAPAPTSLGSWCPTEDEVVAYSGWGHPNPHTDAAFARSIGLSGVIVQGLMVQNRLLAALGERTALALPLTIDTRFSAPVPVGAVVDLGSIPSRDGRHRLVATVDGRVACTTSVELAA